MNRTWAVGEMVWAKVSSRGWRAAAVIFPGYAKKWVPIEFYDVRENLRLGKYGKRLPTALRPRDPRKNGKDKPSAGEAAAI